VGWGPRDGLVDDGRPEVGGHANQSTLPRQGA